MEKLTTARDVARQAGFAALRLHPASLTTTLPKQIHADGIGKQAWMLVIYWECRRLLVLIYGAYSMNVLMEFIL